MKKEELISIIDDIQPDVHMKNRLKAKVIGGASKAKPKRITKPIIALPIGIREEGMLSFQHVTTILYTFLEICQGVIPEFYIFLPSYTR